MRGGEVHEEGWSPQYGTKYLNMTMYRVYVTPSALTRWLVWEDELRWGIPSFTSLPLDVPKYMLNKDAMPTRVFKMIPTLSG